MSRVPPTKVKPSPFRREPEEDNPEERAQLMGEILAELFGDDVLAPYAGGQKSLGVYFVKAGTSIPGVTGNPSVSANTGSKVTGAPKPKAPKLGQSHPVGEPFKGPSGRWFVVKESGGRKRVVPARNPNRVREHTANVNKAHEHVKFILEHVAKGEQPAKITDAISGLTVQGLKDLKRMLHDSQGGRFFGRGGVGSGRKQQLAAKIAARITGSTIGQQKPGKDTGEPTPPKVEKPEEASPSEAQGESTAEPQKEEPAPAATPEQTEEPLQLPQEESIQEQPEEEPPLPASEAVEEPAAEKTPATGSEEELLADPKEYARKLKDYAKPPSQNEQEKIADYQQNGVRSKAFKEWFGDWENGAGSKVLTPAREPSENSPVPPVDAKLRAPRKVFHGTPWNRFDEFDKSKLGDGDELLYGPGFYFTDSPDIAQDYKEIGSGYVDIPKMAWKGGRREAAAKILEMTGGSDGFHDKWGEAADRYKEAQDKFTELVNEWEKAEDAQDPEGIHMWDESLLEGDGYSESTVFKKYKPQLAAAKKAEDEAENNFKQANDTKYFLRNLEETQKVVSDPSFSQAGADVDKAYQFMDKFGSLKYAVGDKLSEIGTPQEGHKFEVYLNIRNPFDVKEDSIDTSKLSKEAVDYINQKNRKGPIAINGTIAEDMSSQDLDRMLAALKTTAYPKFQRHGFDGRSLQLLMKYNMGGEADHIFGDPDIQKVLKEAGYSVGKGAGKLPEELDYDSLTQLVGGKINTNEALKKMGYDGITHKGSFGARAGKVVQGAEEGHRVWIAFEPNQVKEVANQGTFDPASNKIDKALKVKALRLKYRR